MQMERGKEERRDEKEGGKEEEKGSYIVAISGQPSSNIFGLLASSSLRLSDLFLSFFPLRNTYYATIIKKKFGSIPPIYLVDHGKKKCNTSKYVHVYCKPRFFLLAWPFCEGFIMLPAWFFLYLQGLQYCSKGQGGQQLV